MKQLIQHLGTGILALGMVFSLNSCTEEGCTDPLATNYEEDAEEDDGSCEYPDPTTVSLEIIPVFDGTPLALNEDYINITGDRLQFTELKLILTDIKLGNQMVSDAAYYDISNGNAMITTDEAVEPGSYSGLEFTIGVGGDRNNGDPSQYEPGHPLSFDIAGNMHWSWNTGYIFYKIEGRYDSLNTQGSGTPSELFLYHLGMNEYRKTWSDPNYSLDIIEEQDNVIQLELDIAKVFYDATDTIYISSGEDFTHTGPNQETLNIKLSELFPNILSAK